MPCVEGFALLRTRGTAHCKHWKWLVVHKCICYDVEFARVAELAKGGKDFEQISQETGCCQGCGMCEPYVRYVIESGRVSLPVLKPHEVEAIMQRAQQWKLEQQGKGS